MLMRGMKRTTMWLALSWTISIPGSGCICAKFNRKGPVYMWPRDVILLSPYGNASFIAHLCSRRFAVFIAFLC
jgi:hypothetical protein